MHDLLNIKDQSSLCLIKNKEDLQKIRYFLPWPNSLHKDQEFKECNDTLAKTRRIKNSHRQIKTLKITWTVSRFDYAATEKLAFLKN